MKIGITNTLKEINGSIAVTGDANSFYGADVMLQPTFATKYRSNGTATSFTIVFTYDAPTNIDYAVVGGHNAGDGGSTIEIRVNGVLRLTREYKSTSVYPGMSEPAMAIFDTVAATTVEFKFLKPFGSSQAFTVVNVQAGETANFTDPINDSEESGYLRPWLGTGVSNKVTTNRESRPTVSLVKQDTKRVTLTIRNLQGVTGPGSIQDGIHEFLVKMAIDTIWYMRERDDDLGGDNSIGSYMCFDGDLSFISGSRRTLDTLKLSFNAYIGARG